MPTPSLSQTSAPAEASYTFYLSHPGSFYLLGCPYLKKLLLKPCPKLSLAAATQIGREANHLRQLAGISLQAVQLRFLHYLIPRTVSAGSSQGSDSGLWYLPLKHSCGFLEGQIPELAGLHSGDSSAGLQVQVPAFRHRFFSCWESGDRRLSKEAMPCKGEITALR